jgi:hypothetical protein
MRSVVCSITPAPSTTAPERPAPPINDIGHTQSGAGAWLGRSSGPQAERGRLPARPGTPLKNTGHDYHGCLRVDVLGGSDLYQKIEGWAAAAMAAERSAP